MIHDHFIRFKIISYSQHLLQHDLSTLPYSHGSLPGVSSIQSALNWFAAVLYPRTKAAVANPAALPLGGNTLLDYRVVTDDGDGKAAAYRWEQREGDVAAKWYKIYDMDWGEGSILARFLDSTQDLYPYKYGFDDLDDTGTPLAGVNAGQHIFGGASASTHLTFHANAGDGVGAQTGYIQFADQVRPTADGTIDLGSITGTNNRFRSLYLTTNGYIGTLVLGGGSITDTSGAISFGDENLTSTGTMNADSFHASANISEFKSGSTIGLFSFTGVTIDHATPGATILLNKDVQGLSFKAGNIYFNADTIRSQHASNDLILTTNGTGGISVLKRLAVASPGILLSDAADLEFYNTGGVKLKNLAIGVTERLLNATGDLTLQASGSLLLNTSLVKPTTDATTDLGVTGVTPYRFKNGYFSGEMTAGSATIGNYAIGATKIQATNGIVDLDDDNIITTGYIGNGTLSISMSTLLSLRDINSGPPATGSTLFWDGSKWNPSAPDTEIDHGTISGLGDDDHTQYLKLAGRAGGQTVYGGTAASNNLVIDSTSDGAKGHITFGSILRPSADGTIDLGTSAYYLKDAYVAGQIYGFRLPNYTTAGRPSASAGTKGRIIWDTDLLDCLIDGGGFWLKMTIDRWEYEDNSTWNGSQTTATYTVDGTDTPARGRVSDSRTCIWQMKDNTNNHKIMSEATIDHPSSTQVRITFDVAPPAGTYRLIGIG